LFPEFFEYNEGVIIIWLSQVLRKLELKIETENLEDHQVKLTVEVDSDQLEAAKRKAARKLAKRIKIPGFRPGKAPYGVIQRHVGDEALLEESLEILVSDIYPDIIDQAEIDPYGPGKLDNIVNLEPLTLDFIVPLMADVELGDYHDIRFPYDLPEVTGEDVDAVVEDFRQRQAIVEPVKRPAESSDYLSVRLSAKPFKSDEENEETVLIEERSISIIIAQEGRDSSQEWPFDGFSRELIGMSAGEEKTLIYSYPEDSEDESLQSVTAEFLVNVEDVKSRTLPELNDEFAQSLGEYEDLASLRKEIRTSLEQRSEEAYNSEYDDQIIDAIVDSSTIKYPPQMLENEINEVIYQLERRLGNQGLDLETYLMTRDIDRQGLEEEARPVAETRVKRSLVVLEVAQNEGIDVSEDELKQETDRTLDSLSQFLSDSDRRKFSSQDVLSNIVGNIYAEMRMTRTIEYLRDLAKGDLETEAEKGESEEGDASQSRPETEDSQLEEPSSPGTHPEEKQVSEQERIAEEESQETIQEKPAEQESSQEEDSSIEKDA
jgi:trigger factor